ncbi:hypothetical protein PR001_g22689 [Phytophthora rubi]|uniref:Uncharacterized protein n=1 Tax=Phytophthora rubi TaxID=129364 RepID=A0A6A3ISZ9_9STRA|nr:hypothetical protein PR001_g22689 [Phytophthora rubi]
MRQGKRAARRSSATRASWATAAVCISSAAQCCARPSAMGYHRPRSAISPSHGDQLRVAEIL